MSACRCLADAWRGGTRCWAPGPSCALTHAGHNQLPFGISFSGGVKQSWCQPTGAECAPSQMRISFPFDIEPSWQCAQTTSSSSSSSLSSPLMSSSAARKWRGRWWMRRFATGRWEGHHLVIPSFWLFVGSGARGGVGILARLWMLWVCIVVVVVTR